MATTVKYNGETLGTVENETKTLQTAGSWLTGDIVLEDTTAGGGGEWTSDGIADQTEPIGALALTGEIGDYAFYKRAGITSITGATSIGAFGCAYCSSLESVDLSNLLTHTAGRQAIQQHAFDSCTSLKKIETNTTAAVGNYLTANSGVEEVYLPYVASVGNYSVPSSGFRNSPKLKKAFLSRASMTAATSYQNTPADLFRNCPLLEVADIGWAAANQFKAMFTDCPSLRTIITRGATRVPTLSAWSLAVFGGVYSNPTESKIYIPEALYNHLGDGTVLDFQSATNWSLAYAAGVTFEKIEGSPYEL